MELKSGTLTFRAAGKLRTVHFALGVGVKREGPVEVIAEKSPARVGKVWCVRVKASEPVTLESMQMECQQAFAADERIFLNGYQSWTNSREFRPDERIPGLPAAFRPLYERHKLDGYGDYLFHRYSSKPGMLHAFTYTYIRRSNGSLWFAGSLSESAGFTIFNFDTGKGRMVISKDCQGVEVSGEWKAFDIFIAEGDDNRCFDAYFAEMGIAKPRMGTTPGWTSWYNYYTAISEEIVLSNAKAFLDKKVPISIFQVDDGYQTAVGDWLSIKPTFPRGMQIVAEGIQALGFKAGLWLAPFICEQKSKIANEHPDWIVKDKKGSNFIVGNNDLWGGHFYALDLYHPEVRAYLTQVFTTVLQEWRYDMVKLDFLHAVAALPRRDKTRGQIMCDGMDFLRELCGEKLILGCGVPLGPAFGKVDYCRIGPDVHLGWEEVNAAKIHYRERVSTINSIGNAIGRRHLNGRAFVSDPDVFILRSEKNNLTSEQKHSLFLVNCLFGDLLFMSDFLDNYSKEEMENYSSLYPLCKRTIRSVKSKDEVYRWFEPSTLGQLFFGVKPYANVYLVEFDVEAPTGKRSYWAAMNLGDKKVALEVPEGDYWDGFHGRAVSGKCTIEVQPFETLCLYRLKKKGRGFEILGGRGHVFSGCEVLEASAKGRTLSLKRHGLKGRSNGVWLAVEASSGEYEVEGSKYAVVELTPELHAVKVE